MLGHSILSSNFLDMVFQPLQYDQSAPPGFTLLVALATNLVGFSELSARALPQAASIATVVLACQVAMEHLRTKSAQQFFVGMTAFSPFLVFYGQELKQYAVDAAAMMYMLLWRHTKNLKGVTLRHGLILSLISLTSFIGAIAATIMTANAAIRCTRRTAIKTCLRIVLPVTAACALHVCYLFLQQRNRSDLADWWESRDGFPPSSGLTQQLLWFSKKMQEILYAATVHGDIGFTTLDIQSPNVLVVAAAASLVGATFMVRRNPVLFACLVVTAVLSALSLYPVNSRLSMYLIPVLLLGLANVFDKAVQVLAGGLPYWVLTSFVAVLVYSPLVISLQLFSVPDTSRNILDAIEYVEREREANEFIVINGTTEVIYSLYVKSGLVSEVDRVVVMDDWSGPIRAWTDTDESALAAWSDIAAVPDNENLIPPRGWFIASHRQMRMREAVSSLVEGNHAILLCEKLSGRVYIAALGMVQEIDTEGLCNTDMDDVP